MTVISECAEERVGVDCYQFRLTGIGARVAVTSAHLWLYKTRDVIGHHFADSSLVRNQTITVMALTATAQRRRRLERPGSGHRSTSSSGGAGRGGRVVATVNVQRRSGCWVRVNVRRAVLDQLQGPGAASLRLGVECRGGCVLARGRPTPVQGGISERRPVLVVGTVETGRRRSRRTLDGACPQSSCCLHPLYVNFTRDFGWRFIAHPPGYMINYCHGPCNCKSSIE